MDDKSIIGTERRMSKLESSIAYNRATLSRNTEILDDIREHLNKPTITPQWVGVTTTLLSVICAVVYTAYIKPLSEDIKDMQGRILENTAIIRDVKDYEEETRRALERITGGNPE